MLSCIQCRAGSSKEVPDWATIDEIITDLNNNHVTGRARALLIQEITPRRYRWKMPDGRFMAGIAFELRYLVPNDRDQTWNSITGTLTNYSRRGLVIGYEVIRHECNHDNLSVPEGPIEKVVG